jgi:hypothetical protein
LYKQQDILGEASEYHKDREDIDSWLLQRCITVTCGKIGNFSKCIFFLERGKKSE